MHSPRREPVEAGNNRLGHAFAIGAARETGERRARERPIRSQHVLHHRFQRSGFGLEERCGLLERGLIQEFAGVRGVFRDWNELALKLSKLDGERLPRRFKRSDDLGGRRRLGRSWLA